MRVAKPTKRDDDVVSWMSRISVTRAIWNCVAHGESLAESPPPKGSSASPAQGLGIIKQGIAVFGLFMHAAQSSLGDPAFA